MGVQICTLAEFTKTCRNRIMTTKKPSVFDYLDVCQFLQTHYEWRKEHNPDFSLAKWSEELGLGSKVTLRFILKGMRSISPRSALVFRSQLFTTDLERNCFDALISYSQAKTTSEKQSFGMTLLALHKQSMTYVAVDASVVEKSIYAPLVLALLTFQDLPKNSKTLAQLLNADENLISRVLEQLESEKLVNQSSCGEYQVQGDLFKFPDNPSLRKFYEYWIDRSKQALDLPREVRKYRSLNFALTPGEYETALEKLNEYAAGLMSKFNHDSFSGRRLYMYETCLFPVSEPHMRNQET